LGIDATRIRTTNHTVLNDIVIAQTHSHEPIASNHNTEQHPMYTEIRKTREI